MAWLDAALDRAPRQVHHGGRRTSVLCRRQRLDVDGYETSRALKRLLLERGVAIVMAGDTHDLEYHLERCARRTPSVHYFVNGGGGAYLSFGTSLALAGEAANRRLGVLSRPGRR